MLYSCVTYLLSFVLFNKVYFLLIVNIKHFNNNNNNINQEPILILCFLYYKNMYNNNNKLKT